MARPRSLLGLVFALTATGPATAQSPRKGPPPYTSPEVRDGNMTFRIWAAKAEKVGLASSDIPGGGSGTDKYPVFYLLHGAGDGDDTWTSVGRAHDILDNLIAAKKAVPMVVVMPAGHDSTFAFGRPTGVGGGVARFENDFTNDLRPHIERTYRVKTDRADRAIAGLSMGGLQTLNVFAARPADYAAVGVFSSGVFGNKEALEAWAKQHAEKLSATTARDVKVLWFATGKDDFVLNSTKGTIELLQKLELKPEYKETAGGHTWINWQQYLNEFAPRLFR